MEVYDVAIIGTSPACVLEMALLKKQGLKTIMIDQSTEIGGSWGTIDIPILGRVESGAHYLGPDSVLYDLFEKVIGVKMEIVENPKYFFPRRVFGRTYSPWLNRWGSGVAPANEGLPTSIRTFRNLVSPYYRCLKETLNHLGAKKFPMKYFFNGTIGLVDRLAKFIENEKLQTMMKTSVTSVEVYTSTNTVVLKTSKGDVSTKKFILTSCAKLNEIFVDGKEMFLPMVFRPLVQLHLVVKGPRVERLSFGQFSSSPNLLLATNLTPYLDKEFKNDGYSLLANLVLETHPQTDETVNKIIEEHKYHGSLSEEHILIYANWKQYDVPQLQDDELQEIEIKFSPHVGVLPTHSLGGERAIRWWNALQPLQ